MGPHAMSDECGSARAGNADTDAELVARAAAGDVDAFEELVRKWKDRVFRLAFRFFRRREDAEDVAQEVFLRMFRAIGSYRSDAPFEHWLLRIATNVSRDELRERRRKPAVVLSDITGEPAAWLDRALSGAALVAAEAGRARALAADLLDSLSPGDRIVLVLMDLEGMSAAETAAATGSTRGAVKVRAMRARRALCRLAERVERRGR